MNYIIRSIQENDFNKGFQNLYNKQINLETFKKLINNHSTTYVLYNIKLDTLNAVILSNTINILNETIFNYTIYFNNINNCKLLFDNFVLNTKGKYYFRPLYNFDITNNKFIKLVDNKLNKININNTFILHSDNLNDYISIRTIDKYESIGKNTKTNIFSDIVNINLINNHIIDNILFKIYPIKIRQLELEDVNKGFEQVINQLNKSNNNKFNKNKCNEFIHKMIYELNNISKVYVMTNLNNIIGTATIFYQPKLHRLSENIEYAAFIEDVVIDKSCRGLGLGNTFVKYLINKSKFPDIELLNNYKIYKISLNCSDNLCKFYEKSDLIKSGAQMTKYLYKL